MDCEFRPSLTAKQDRLLRFIESSLEHSRVAPSFEAMKAHLGISSKSGVHRLLGSLEERGYIKRTKNRARAIALGSPLSGVPAYVLMAELRSRGIEVKVVTA